MTSKLKFRINKTKNRRLLSAKYSRFLEPTKLINYLSRTKWFSPTKLACIPLLCLIIALWAGAANAQDQELTPEYIKGVLDAIWILVASVFVIFMNAGFGMLESGFCRQKNTVNILAKNLIVFAIATLVYWSIGFSIMFAGDHPFIGAGGFFLTGESSTYGLNPFPAGLPVPVFFLFQAAFAATAATIVSGAVAERVEFLAFLLFSILITGISYPITGHWIWGSGGWLGAMGFKDFAGSTAVHSVGGWAALVGAYILRPRRGKYDEKNQPQAIPGHNMGFATLGCLILWIGWFGFNPGSQLAADENVVYIAVTTNLAAAAGGATAAITSWSKDKKPDLSMIINGVLAGLVGITAGCDGVSYLEAVIIGSIAGMIVVFSVSFFDKLTIDDPVGAISVHLICGIWGTLAVGIFVEDTSIITQFIGIISVGLFTVILSSIFWLALRATVGIRVHPEQEYKGLDISEHGMEAYHGFVKEPDSLATGVSHDHIQ
ncbi:ammonium transporter [Trichodesmium erythraeum IMS101]|uniref:Ammonium transporter n=1 Tax=Trichodesmium erythraeum (strain IMS101) TaxID=203124 RepID=Q10WB0_TRIEI|nr:ammonium transporter [Trichodesmium erythraeum GBRTRLIN201]